MGLDTVELIVSIEKRFDISIPDSEAQRLATVKDVIEFVHQKVTLNPSQRCKSQILFYRLRHYLIDDLGIARESVNPKAKLRDIFPSRDLENSWKRIGTDLNLSLPDLSPSDINPSAAKKIRILGIPFKTTKHAITEKTISELIEWILALNHEKLIDPKNLCSRQDIERIVLGITANSSGNPIDEIKLSYSFTSDLGMD